MTTEKQREEMKRLYDEMETMERSLERASSEREKLLEIEKQNKYLSTEIAQASTSFNPNNLQLKPTLETT